MILLILYGTIFLEFVFDTSQPFIFNHVKVIIDIHNFISYISFY